MFIIRTIFFWLVFLCSTVSFVVLIEHGPSNFEKNFKAEMGDFENFLADQVFPEGENGEPRKHPQSIGDWATQIQKNLLKQ